MRNKLVIGLVAGATVGAVAGLLFAPNPGQESRQIVATQSWGIRHKTGSYFHRMRSWRKSKEPVMAGPFDLRGT